MFWKSKKDKSPSISSGSTNPFESDTASNYTQPSSAAPSYHSTPSQDYAAAPRSGGGRYGTRRNDDEYQSQQRDQLLGNAGQQQRRQPPSQRYGGYDDENDDDAYGSSRYAQDEDEEVGNIKSQIRNVKQDSLESTRRALQRLNETEQTAGNTMGMLNEQSGK